MKARIANLLGWLLVVVAFLIALGKFRTMAAERDRLVAELQDLRQASNTLNRSAWSNVKVSGSKTASGNVTTVSQSEVSSLDTNADTDDLALAKLLARRRESGDYVLKLEDPLEQRVAREAISNLVSGFHATNSKSYMPLFEQFGVDQKTAEQLVSHITKIQEAYLHAESSIRQMRLAQADYDRRLKQLLPAEKYAEYAAYEDKKPAVEELKHIQAFAKSEGLPDLPALNDSIADVIRQIGTYATRQTQIGPYTSVPEAFVGSPELALQRMNDEMQALAEAAGRIRQIASAAGLPSQTSEMLVAYYTSEANRRAFSIERLTRVTESEASLGRPLSPEELESTLPPTVFE